MTEAEAKNRACCGPGHASEWAPGIVVDGRRRRASPEEQSDPSRLTYFSACRASDCMAWRWVVTPATAARFAAAKLENPRSEGPTEASGYCGLAGAPQ